MAAVPPELAARASIPPRPLYRLALPTAVVTTILGAIAQLLHPLPTPDEPLSFLETVTGSDAWVVLHMIGLASYFIALIPLLAIVRSLVGTSDLGGLLAFFASVMLTIATAVATVWIILDGIAMKRIADAWEVAPAAEKETAFRVANALEDFILSLFSVELILYTGIPFVLLGIAVALSRIYPAWLGWIAVVIGAGSTITGSIQFFTFRDAIVTHVMVPLFVVPAVLWVPVTAYFLWRRFVRDDGAPAAAAPARG